MPQHPTIFALSSGRGPAAIAVVRISGPRAGAALISLGVKIPEPRKAGLARLRDPRTADIIDEALVLWFPAPHSETGEDVAELQLHGGRAVIAATLAALSRVEGLRPAEAGEFTRRAFENGKLDLTAVEGLADLVMAETQGQRRQAFRQMNGLLGGRAESWRQRLIQALALVEARIDFSDEADVPENLLAPALTMARELADEIAAALADGGRGERLREGLVVAIAGPPNAGKSTLLNRIARREAAIVSPYAGTTRDVIEVHLDLGGLPVTLLDTAGIRETDDPVELEGVRRARERAAGADLVLWVVDASGPEAAAVIPGSRAATAPRNDGDSRPGAAAAPASRDLLPAVEMVPPPSPAPVASVTTDQPPTWLVRNKIDLLAASTSSESILQFKYKSEPIVRSNEALKPIVNRELAHKIEHQFTSNEVEFTLSATTGEGFDQLLAALAGYADNFMAGAESALVTRERHRRALEETLAALRRAQSGEVAGREDLLAEELRIAARALGRLTGRVDVEDILDVIFRDFCIGK
ncbi:MAG: tRNA uridine-5-carboxymethylaminomethyl(34) synthesis GTPase MnmE [Rhizobiales bacterium]|nr:tRNA uridine-5-carboxymethylaminomethyl(34) synthesis GTPase MnmE [Hyphomicrobiales bacterium]